MLDRFAPQAGRDVAIQISLDSADPAVNPLAIAALVLALAALATAYLAFSAASAA